MTEPVPKELPCGWCGQPAVIVPHQGLRCACTPALSAAEHLEQIRVRQAQERKEQPA